jgi:hypothetical protein
MTEPFGSDDTTIGAGVWPVDHRKPAASRLTAHALARRLRLRQRRGRRGKSQHGGEALFVRHHCKLSMQHPNESDKAWISLTPLESLSDTHFHITS